MPFEVSCRTMALADAALAKLLHQPQRFFADVVFDAFAVDGCGSLAHSQSQQKLIHDFMSTLGKLSKAAAFLGKAHGSIGLCVDVAIPLHSGHSAVDGHVTDSKSFGQIPDSAFSQPLMKLRDRFHVVLRQLGRMIATSSLVAFRSGLCFFHKNISWSFTIVSEVTNLDSAAVFGRQCRVRVNDCHSFKRRFNGPFFGLLQPAAAFRSTACCGEPFLNAGKYKPAVWQQAAAVQGNSLHHWLSYPRFRCLPFCTY
jgi:hypothetical protein